VNGTLVVDNDTVLPVKPGQTIRYPIEREGRFEPVEVHSRLSQITIPSGSFGDDTGFGQSALNPKR